MKYSGEKGKYQNSTFKLDGEDSYDIDNVSEIISKYTDIPLVKIKNCVIHKGLKALFDNPSLVGANGEQIILLSEIKELVDWGFGNTYESI